MSVWIIAAAYLLVGAGVGAQWASIQLTWKSLSIPEAIYLGIWVALTWPVVAISTVVEILRNRS